MQVILLEKNEKLGNLGDIANVKSGYARNYLIPQGKAKPANKANMAVFETLRAELEAKEAAALSDAQSLETAMKDVVCTISANAGEEGSFMALSAQLTLLKIFWSKVSKLKRETSTCLKLLETLVSTKLQFPYMLRLLSLLRLSLLLLLKQNNSIQFS
jgi:hypothetical protein